MSDEVVLDSFEQQVAKWFECTSELFRELQKVLVPSFGTTDIVAIGFSDTLHTEQVFWSHGTEKKRLFRSVDLKDEIYFGLHEVKSGTIKDFEGYNFDVDLQL